MFHELSETVSDPEYGISGAWGAGVTGESGDLCAWNFGTWSALPKASNGAHYDVNISGVNYLIQQMYEVSIAKPVAGTYIRNLFPAPRVTSSRDYNPFTYNQVFPST